MNKISTLKKWIDDAEGIVIGAGAGLSTSAGFTYSGERFNRFFSDFRDKYRITDMYSGGFYPFPSMEEYWGWWSRQIYVNRYMDASNSVYSELLELVQDKDYFVLTTNVDHQFQKAGFDKKRLFYTQGDYGLWQCKEPCHYKTYDNEETVIKMLLSQGFLKEQNGHYDINDTSEWSTSVDSNLIPHCPVCGEPMTMNLRCDDSFVEDEGWHQAAERYSTFLRRYESLNILFIELGTGMNTPVIIKYPFWRMTHQWKNAKYVCVNLNEAYAPKEIKQKSLCFDSDVGEWLALLNR